MDEHEPPIIETGIPCYRCGERPGLDCPGRKPDEATLCEHCFKEHMAAEMERQAIHQAKYIVGVRDGGGAEEVRRVFWDIFGEEEREGIRKILGDAGVERILNADESGLCFDEMEKQGRHLRSYLDGVRDSGGVEKVRESWEIFSEEQKESVRKVIGELWVDGILN